MLSVASNGRAQQPRVATIDVDPIVGDAVVIALSPYGVAVVRAPGAAPDPNAPAAAERGGQIAAEQGASAVVWMTPARDASNHGWLWLYSAETLELTMRPLAVAPPFDAAEAAAIALSVKTALRSSNLVAGSHLTASIPVPIARTVPGAPEPPRPLTPPEPAHLFRLETFIGARGSTGIPDTLEPRGSLGASAWPSPLHGWLGIGAAVQAGSGMDVNTNAFNGRFTFTSLVASLRLRREAARWFALELQAGPALILTSMTGSLPSQRVSAQRFDGALDFGLVADIAVGPRVCIGPVVNGLWLMRFQTYGVASTAAVFVQPPFGAVFGLRLSVLLD